MNGNPEIPFAPASIIDDDLVDFFDLLARFDFEDKHSSGINPDSSDPVPGESGFEPEPQSE